MSPPNRRLTFPKARRLRSRQDYARVYERRLKAGDRSLLVFADRADGKLTRIGLSVSRKNGNSVVRHRIRRLLREAYRLEQHDIPEGLDLILIPRPGSAATLADYRRSLVQLTQKLARRLDDS